MDPDGNVHEIPMGLAKLLSVDNWKEKLNFQTYEGFQRVILTCETKEGEHSPQILQLDFSQDGSLYYS